jgi:hypothetical protein
MKSRRRVNSTVRHYLSHMSDSIWRTQLGWLSFLLAKAFAGGLVLTLIGATWLGVEGRNGAIGFFGFGIPMIVADLGTAALWSGEKSLQKTLGWSSTVTGLVCGVARLFLWALGCLLTTRQLRRAILAISWASAPQCWCVVASEFRCCTKPKVSGFEPACRTNRWTRAAGACFAS